MIGCRSRPVRGAANGGQDPSFAGAASAQNLYALSPDLHGTVTARKPTLGLSTGGAPRTRGRRSAAEAHRGTAHCGVWHASNRRSLRRSSVRRAARHLPPTCSRRPLALAACADPHGPASPRTHPGAGGGRGSQHPTRARAARGAAHRATAAAGRSRARLRRTIAEAHQAPADARPRGHHPPHGRPRRRRTRSHATIERLGGSQPVRAEGTAIAERLLTERGPEPALQPRASRARSAGRSASRPRRWILRHRTVARVSDRGIARQPTQQPPTVVGPASSGHPPDE